MVFLSLFSICAFWIESFVGNRVEAYASVSAPRPELPRFRLLRLSYLGFGFFGLSYLASASSA